MAGQQRAIVSVLVLGLFLCALRAASAQSRDTEDAERPIGGITFDPPRSAILRHKAGNVIRGDLMAISPEQVQFRLQSGKVFLYELREIRSIVTSDRAFRYNSAYDTYRKAEESARGLPGVKILAVTTTASASPGTAPKMPIPPAPPMPVLFDPPSNYRAVRIDPSEIAGAGAPHGAAGGANHAAAIPPIPTTQRAANNAGVANVPIYETGAFKIGFLAACFVVILLWWRNRVG